MFFFWGENEHTLNEGEMEVIVAESGLWGVEDRGHSIV